MLPTMVNMIARNAPKKTGTGKILEGTENGIMMSKDAIKNFEIPTPLKRCIHPTVARIIKGTLRTLIIRFSRATISSTSCVCQPRAFITPISLRLSESPNPEITPIDGMPRAKTRQ
jgi:hypothetical protein